MDTKKRGGRTLGEQLQRSLRRLIAATLLLYLLNFGLGYYVYVIARDNTEGLCAIKADAEQRFDTTTKYLIAHPKGSKQIPIGVIKSSIAGAQRTIDSLQAINCPAPPKLIPTPTPKSKR